MKVKSILNFQDAFFVEIVLFPVNNKPNQGSLPPNLVMIILESTDKVTRRQ